MHNLFHTLCLTWSEVFSSSVMHPSLLKLNLHSFEGKHTPTRCLETNNYFDQILNIPIYDQPLQKY